MYRLVLGFGSCSAGDLKQNICLLIMQVVILGSSGSGDGGETNKRER
jgi:hypothetical protein